ncbi:MAG TPA: peptidase C39 family protein [Herpetosiphonaceae bacterium]|nr:peptidase C39 family protein [Herpetosiphonaceae bacterium]
MPPLPTSLVRWTVNDLVSGEFEGLALVRGVGMRLLPGAAEGVVVGPVTAVPSGFVEAIVSWQAQAPGSTQLEIGLRAEIDGHWSRWWTMGLWSSDPSYRGSVNDQQDADGTVETDTLVLERPAQALQWRVVFRSAWEGQSPLLSGIAVMLTPPESQPVNDRMRVVEPLMVPELSQMQTPGGAHWCSAVALTMVLRYWYERNRAERLKPFMASDAVERLTAPGVNDPVWGGTGNWAFNTAFAGSLGLEAYVARFASLAELARWVASGVPVIASIAFGPGELDDTPSGFERSAGHLVVVVGFGDRGDVIVNDPRANPGLGESVRRVYPRQQFKQAWQSRSRGTVYLIYPRRHG